MLNGTCSAPIRSMASHETTHSMPYGKCVPTRVPLPTPAASSCFASARERASACRYVSRSVSVTTSFVVAEARDGAMQQCRHRRLDVERWSIHDSPGWNGADCSHGFSTIESGRTFTPGIPPYYRWPPSTSHGGAGHVAGVVRQEKRDHPCHLVSVAEVAGGYAVEHLLDSRSRRERQLGHRRVDVARLHRVHADSHRRPLDPEHPGDADHTCLRRRVRDPSAVADLRVHRADVHDRARYPSRPSAGPNTWLQRHRAAQVHVDDLVPPVLGELFRSRQRADTRVVDERVDRPERGFDRRGRGAYRFPRPHIELNRDRRVHRSHRRRARCRRGRRR